MRATASLPVGGAADDRRGRASNAEDGLERLREEVVVVGDQDADGRGVAAADM